MTDVSVQEIEDEHDSDCVESPLADVSAGARYLVRKEYGTPLIEVRVKSVAPSRKFIEFERLGWQPVDAYEIVERLSEEPAA